MNDRQLFNTATADVNYGLFFGPREAALFNDWNVEINEIVVQQSIIYYPIEKDLSDPNSLYGESDTKISQNPIKVYGRILLDEPITITGQFTTEQKKRVEVYLTRSRLIEIGLIPRMGDFFIYDNQAYEIVDLKTPRFMLGYPEQKMDVIMTGISTRENIFSIHDPTKEVEHDSENPF